MENKNLWKEIEEKSGESDSIRFIGDIVIDLYDLEEILFKRGLIYKEDLKYKHE